MDGLPPASCFFPLPSRAGFAGRGGGEPHKTPKIGDFWGCFARGGGCTPTFEGGLICLLLTGGKGKPENKRKAGCAPQVKAKRQNAIAFCPLRSSPAKPSFYPLLLFLAFHYLRPASQAEEDCTGRFCEAAPPFNRPSCFFSLRAPSLARAPLIIKKKRGGAEGVQKERGGPFALWCSLGKTSFAQM